MIAGIFINILLSNSFCEINGNPTAVYAHPLGSITNVFHYLTVEQKMTEKYSLILNAGIEKLPSYSSVNGIDSITVEMGYGGKIGARYFPLRIRILYFQGDLAYFNAPDVPYDFITGDIIHSYVSTGGFLGIEFTLFKTLAIYSEIGVYLTIIQDKTDNQMKDGKYEYPGKAGPIAGLIEWAGDATGTFILYQYLPYRGIDFNLGLGLSF